MTVGKDRLFNHPKGYLTHNKMEAKQFPEKWAVRGSQEFKNFVNEKFGKDKYSTCMCTEEEHYYWLGEFGNVNTSTKANVKPNGYTEVTLEDLIAHYEPTTHPKWMPLTSGGFEYKIYEEFDERLFGRLKMSNGSWVTTTWKLIGQWGSQEYDLIPYNPRIAELEEKITSKRSELAELEGELNTLKGK